jgi:hypothetical protein
VRETGEAEARSVHFIHAVFQAPHLRHRYLRPQAIPDSAAIRQASTVPALSAPVLVHQGNNE